MDTETTLIGLLEIAIIAFVIYIFWYAKDSKERKIDEEKKMKKKLEIDRQTREIDEKIENEKIYKKISFLIKQLGNSNSKNNIKEITELKSFIIENENSIIAKGGDEILFQFLKIDTFLQDFRNLAINEIKDISINYLDTIQLITNKIEEGVKSKNLNKVESLALKIDDLFNIGKKIKSGIKQEIDTLFFYKSMALSMLIFYLNNKKIRYFEIYEAFEKLGAFDSSWQKNVASKLGSIDDNLISINNKMTELNDNFIRLVENTDSIVKELEDGFDEINNKIDLNNLLQGITAYNVYKINKQTKSLLPKK
ncbi:MAG: hypothetical protein ACOYMD_07505 [Paludibacter sp.]